ncbi:MAG: T9SS type A sorting domain-containing protein [Bacteroidales bacterium]
MKHLLLILSVFSIALHSNSQSLSLSDLTSPVPNNGDIFLSGGTDPIDCYITVNNVTGSNKNVECKKAYLQPVAGSMDYFCWGACYPPNTLVGVVPVLIGANQSNSTNFSGHYDCQGNTGTAIIRYTFWVVGNPMDSVCFNAHFTGCAVGIDETEQLSGLSEPYPNPARETINVRYVVQSKGNTSLELINLQGSIIQTIALGNLSGTATIDVSELAKGVYFLYLNDKGKILSRKKVLVD